MGGGGEGREVTWGMEINRVHWVHNVTVRHNKMIIIIIIIFI